MALWLIKMTALRQPSHSRTPDAVRARGRPRVPVRVTEPPENQAWIMHCLFKNPSWRKEGCKAHQFYMNIRHFYSPSSSQLCAAPVTPCSALCRAQPRRQTQAGSAGWEGACEQGGEGTISLGPLVALLFFFPMFLLTLFELNQPLATQILKISFNGLIFILFTYFLKSSPSKSMFFIN